MKDILASFFIMVIIVFVVARQENKTVRQLFEREFTSEIAAKQRVIDSLKREVKFSQDGQAELKKYNEKWLKDLKRAVEINKILGAEMKRQNIKLNVDSLINKN